MYRSLAPITIAFVLLFVTPAITKCVNRFIEIKGEIVGKISDDLQLAVEVTPDPNWEPQGKIKIKNGKFEGTIFFNTTKSEGRTRDNCSRTPDTVEVILLEGETEINRVRLLISKDFVKNKLHDYELRSPIQLQSK